MLLRNLGVIAFIGMAGAAGIYFAQRPTVARGEVLAADLIRSNPQLVKSMTCDRDVPIGVAGATFHCAVELKDGRVERMRFGYDRNGSINQIEMTQAPAVKKTSDPWGD